MELFTVENALLIGRILLMVIAAGIIVTKAIDIAKATGKINPEQAGEYNQIISFVVALAAFVLKWIGVDGQIPEAEALGVELAAIFVTAGSVAIVAKYAHKIVNWLKGERRIVIPEVQTPNVVINMEANPGPK